MKQAAVILLALLTVGPAAGAGAPQRMQVTQDEWSLTLSRQVLSSGRPASIEVFNIGQDAHDLVLLHAAKGAKPLRVRKLAHFEREEVTVRLRPGRYTLWCSLPGHRARGMVAPLRVR